jgi:hypothetical protein
LASFIPPFILNKKMLPRGAAPERKWRTAALGPNVCAGLWAFCNLQRGCCCVRAAAQAGRVESSDFAHPSPSSAGFQLAKISTRAYFYATENQPKKLFGKKWVEIKCPGEIILVIYPDAIFEAYCSPLYSLRV